MYNSLNNNYSSDINKNKTKTFAKFLILLAIGCFGAYFYYNYKNANNLSVENTNLVVSNLAGTWKATKQTEPNNDNVYLIPNVVLQINNDGTCHLKGSYKLRYTDRSGGSTLAADYYCILEVNGKNEIRLVPNDDDANAFHKKYKSFTLDGSVLVLGSFEYTKISSNNNANNNTVNENNNQIVGT